MTTKRMRYTVLARTVIAVAKEGHNNDWGAYIGAVPGENHSLEYIRVLKYGDKLREDVARVLFPGFRDLAWRD